MSHGYSFMFVACLLMFAAAPVVGQEKNDDTALVLALTQYGAGMGLSEGRIIDLRLEGAQITDEVVKLVKDASVLQSLTIMNAKVSGKGLAHLRDLSTLHTLRIEHTPIGDRDVEELVNIKNVNSYILRGTRLSGMGKQRLEALLMKQMRDAAIAFHAGGFFGVAGPLGEERCVLSNVVPQSAAADAGLEVGDVIVEFDGQDVGSFEDLRSVVGLTPPEKAINVRIERGGQSITKTVKLRRGQPPLLP